MPEVHEANHNVHAEVEQLLLQIKNPLHDLMKHVVARHSLRPVGGEYNEHVETMSLVELIPTDFRRACRAYKRIVRQSGIKRFRELTGLRKLNCQTTQSQREVLARGGYVQPISAMQYETMASLIETRTFANAKQNFKVPFYSPGTSSLLPFPLVVALQPYSPLSSSWNRC